MAPLFIDLYVLNSGLPNPVTVGNNITFTITAGNLGPVFSATNAIVTDALPVGYSLVSAVASLGSYAFGVWTIGTINVGASETLTIVATVQASGSYTNTAVISSDEFESNPLNNTASFTPTVIPTPTPCPTICGDAYLDFTKLACQPLSGVTTIEGFAQYLTSLIDVKDRQTLSGYPTLRALYDRYINSSSYSSPTSSAFNYISMNQFANLVGDYWVDIIEQVIPATTIWGSVKIYSNTIFDQQKFKYRAYTSLLCGNPFSGQTVLSPINGTSGTCTGVTVTSTPYVSMTSNVRLVRPIITTCNTLCIAQMNAGSEFIGSVTITPIPSGGGGGGNGGGGGPFNLYAD